MQPLGRSAVALRCIQCFSTIVTTVQVLVQTMPWIACNTWSGEPFDEQSQLLADVKEDLERAKKIDVPSIAGMFEGYTLYKKRGTVRKYFTLVQDIEAMGELAIWRVHYTSHGGRVLWLDTTFDRITWVHEIEAEMEDCLD